MRSPQMMGEEWPLPGMGHFQATFSVSDQRSGNGPDSAETPSRRGPRHIGQGSALAGARRNKPIRRGSSEYRTAGLRNDDAGGEVMIPRRTPAANRESYPNNAP